MELKFKIEQTTDGGYIAYGTSGIFGIGDGNTPIRALEDCFKVTLDILELYQEDGINIMGL